MLSANSKQANGGNISFNMGSERLAEAHSEFESINCRCRCNGLYGQQGVNISQHVYTSDTFLLVCCHLTSGEKDGDELKRNADVEEILRRTVFNPLPGLSTPKGILGHERIIWFGDLNYRINLSYERAHELISKQDWDGLFENDQVI